MTYVRWFAGAFILSLVILLVVQYRPQTAYAPDWVTSSHRCYCNGDCFRPSTAKSGAWLRVPAVRTTCSGGIVEEEGFYTICPAGVSVGARATNCDDTWNVCITCNPEGGQCGSN